MTAYQEFGSGAVIVGWTWSSNLLVCHHPTTTTIPATTTASTTKTTAMTMITTKIITKTTSTTVTTATKTTTTPTIIFTTTSSYNNTITTTITTTSKTTTTSTTKTTTTTTTITTITNTTNTTTPTVITTSATTITTTTTRTTSTTRTTKKTTTSSTTIKTRTTAEPEQAEYYSLVMVSQEPIIIDHIFTDTLTDSQSNDYKTLTAQLGFQSNSTELLEYCKRARISLCLESIRVQRFRQEPVLEDKKSTIKHQKSRTSGSLRTVCFVQANYQLRSSPSEYQEIEKALADGNTTDNFIISLTTNITQTLSYHNIVSYIPPGLGIQSTFSNAYKDPFDLDAELGISHNMIIAAATPELASQLIVANNKTVADIQKTISSQLQLNTNTLDNFAEVTKEELQKVFGNPMIQSVNEFFVTADTCQSYKDCDASGIICRQALQLPGILALVGDVPFVLLVFGIPKKLADEITISLSAATKEINLEIKNLTVFEEEEFKNNTNFFLRATDAHQREGIINIIIAESSHCRSYRRDNNPDENTAVTREIIQEADL